jgi:glucokinase
MSGYLLVGDIGGTNARFAMARDGRLEHSAALETGAYPTPEAALGVYLQGKPAPDAAALAVAAPIVGDTIFMTNSNWSFSKGSLEAELKCPVELVNDFAALARAIPFLAAEDYVRIPRSVVPGHDAEGSVLAIIGPGTGLGVATLVRAGDGWIDLPGEGGHVTMSPATAEEDRIVGLLRERWEHVSAERVLCGDGLVALYEVTCELRNVLPVRRTPAEITAAASGAEPDPHAWLCARAFDIFCAMLGTVAGNLALTVGASELYVAGGILRRFPEILGASRFRYRFEQKGRLSAYLQNVPTYLVLSKTPALTGLANWKRVAARVEGGNG